MQPLGQLFAYLVGFWVTIGLIPNSSDRDAVAPRVDQAWRCIVGVGAIPALVAIIFRLTIPESPRYTLAVQQLPDRALADTRQYLRVGSVAGAPPHVAGPDLEHATELSPSRPGAASHADDDTDSIADLPLARNTSTPHPNSPAKPVPVQFSKGDLVDYFWTQGHWRYLAGTSVCWFLLDFVYYGLGMNSPRILAKVWQDRSILGDNVKDPPFNGTLASTTNVTESWNSFEQVSTIWDTMKQDAEHNIYTVSIGALVGSLILIKIINYVPRRSIMAWSFLALAVLVAIDAGTFSLAFATSLHALTILLNILIQLLFNLGSSCTCSANSTDIFQVRTPLPLSFRPRSFRPVIGPAVTVIAPPNRF